MKLLLAALVGLASVAIFFRVDLLHRFAFTFGDINDARIEISLLEHWRNVFRGLERWRDPLFFGPSKGVLGYNDGYLLFGLPYGLLRGLGADPFVAAELVHALIRMVGFVAFLGFAHHACRIAFAWALLGAAAFTLSNAAYMQVGHAQLLSVGFAPLLGWLVYAAIQALRRNRAVAAAAWGCAAGLLFDAWLMTAFYTLWFTLLFCGVALIVAACQGGKPDWRGLRNLSLWPVAAAAIVSLVGAIPFALTYLPTAHATGMHPFATLVPFLPAPLDLINVGEHNLLFGAANRWLNERLRLGARLDGELAAGFPWFAFALALAGTAGAWFGRSTPNRRYWRIIAGAFLLSLALCVSVDGTTAWWVVYALVPGAAAVRVVCRDLLVLGCPCMLLAIHLLSRQRWHPAVLVAAGLLLLSEEITVQPQNMLSRREELAFVAAIPPPPGACHAFVVTQPRPITATEGPAWTIPLTPNTDAMLLAPLLHVPTLNGHASILPAGFALDMPADDYDDAQVRRYVIERGQEPWTCGLDLRHSRWILPPLPDFAGPVLPPGGQVIAFGGDQWTQNSALPYGWTTAEAPGRWTDGPEASVVFRSAATTKDLLLEVDARGLPLGNGPSPVTLLANGVAVARWQPTGTLERFRTVMPASALRDDGRVELRFIIARPIRPRDWMNTPDVRLLGLFVQKIQVTPVE